jgi:hypothetical protein
MYFQNLAIFFFEIVAYGSVALVWIIFANELKNLFIVFPPNRRG